MYLKVANDDGSLNAYEIVKEEFVEEKTEGLLGYIGTESKEANALNILKAYFSEAKVILFDSSNKAIAEQLEALNVPAFRTGQSTKTIFDKENFNFIYFTSGSTGIPIAALKSKSNLEAEVAVLSALLKKYKIKKVIVTVPFIHLYGTLLGLMYPLMNDIDIVLKEHFLPHELLSMIEPYSMVVTTPLYIKAMNKLAEKKDLTHALFISSTAPLDTPNILNFKQKFEADIMQIFGSTETGGIAYKLNDESLWKPFNGVEISVNSNQELRVKSPFVSAVLYEEIFKRINGEVQTFDYIEEEASGFRLVGRSAKIFKLAGKRYSTIQIEHILENVQGIVNALVFVEFDKASLRGELLDITLETDLAFTVNEIKKILKSHLSNLKFSIKLNLVKEIPKNLVGKKLRIK
ncbi:MAG: Acyl-CoA synthetase / AMP-(Fatty) acid ligase [uncultured Sulfurovum sp.]|uniref:Acyl-CoA synthetase / AMP-(Fatty) acid ligase n=1 Tax=uncultured Sulfurovum sp. TaxID=269237 RepID=A0A6S6T5S6_9BACT|nr:MAG: Acyl-CoA synthetase / AMP-(Fatty) acid ligase [uncultured Sulfurovum sp.]